MTTPPSNHVELRPGAYADSVTLLQVSRAVQGLDGVLAAQVAMATALNIEVLTEMGFEVPPEASTNDLVVALRLADADALTAALAGVDQALRDANRRVEGSTEIAPPRTTAAALRRAAGTPGHDAIVVVSVPGPSAVVEAMDAVDAGRDVLVFSDNVPVEQEVALKRAAAERGVLVMGPDCGTAVVGGLGLGFANVVSPGPVGIVAASGTGCQQLLALLDHAGVGVTSALGVGGRDLSAEVRGASTREALRRLDQDPGVELIVVVSKPPAPDVATEIEAYAAALATPVEFALLGDGRPDLTAAAEAVLRRLGRDVPTWPVSGVAPDSTTGATDGGVIRGLFVGGTLKSEAQLIAGTGAGHTFVDFGDDDYTSGRAHPMIDPTLRLEHLARAAADPATGVLLLDVVLGHGAEPDPAALLAPAVSTVSQPVVIAVVGTAGDPQGRARQVDALVAAGAEVHLSNAGATRRALELLGDRA
ncbi:FdrA family protein [Nocardioides sp. URHA0020]|uniref:FdrA family protein n=1 Tax=Nocardioides sp. URHA0020 TaxID=1380392 RepID=UPI00048A724E|nr:FdrA family protein [Nocardioides sp. URHA0020]